MLWIWWKIVYLSHLRHGFVKTDISNVVLSSYAQTSQGPAMNEEVSHSVPQSGSLLQTGCPEWTVRGFHFHCTACLDSFFTFFFIFQFYCHFVPKHSEEESLLFLTRSHVLLLIARLTVFSLGRRTRICRRASGKLLTEEGRSAQWLGKSWTLHAAAVRGSERIDENSHAAAGCSNQAQADWFLSSSCFPLPDFLFTLLFLTGCLLFVSSVFSHSFSFLNIFSANLCLSLPLPDTSLLFHHILSPPRSLVLVFICCLE